MCTVSFLPLKTGFVLTSSRDETTARPTLPPAVHLHNAKKLVFPKDEIAGGTWIAVAAQKRVACLLNGAFEKHTRLLPYNRSRGQVLLESFDYQYITDFCESTNLTNVEPFTLILIDYSKDFELVEFRWDGVLKHKKNRLPTENAIWSSATLYDAAAREIRSEWFENWLKSAEENNPAHILNFHTTKHSFDEKNDILMQRNGGLQTVSVSQIIVEEEKMIFLYHDWLERKEYELVL